jgi:hypothetical protein
MGSALWRAPDSAGGGPAGPAGTLDRLDGGGAGGGIPRLPLEGSPRSTDRLCQLLRFCPLCGLNGCNVRELLTQDAA